MENTDKKVSEEEIQTCQEYLDKLYPDVVEDWSEYVYIKALMFPRVFEHDHKCSAKVFVEREDKMRSRCK